MLVNRFVPWSLATLIAAGTVNSTISTAIDPPRILAITERLDLPLQREPGESYVQMLQRAEDLAQREVQRLFDTDIVVSDVSVVVMGENNGLVAPLLSIDVRRDRWRQDPDVTRWARYYPNTRDLLGFNTIPAEPPPGEEPVLGTGDVQVTLRWDTTDDLDLAVTDPEGNTAFFANPSVASGGQLDVDSNAGCMDSTSNPVENVFWPTGGAPEGEYVVSVTLFIRCAASSEPISFELTILTQGETRTETGTVSDAEPTITFPFSLP
ncbi:hypothetical protein POG22_22795 [Geitlerinema sp. CS-897]|nr:hypothetical protein [Geitlerinema sp. CS-897]